VLFSAELAAETGSADDVTPSPVVSWIVSVLLLRQAGVERPDGRPEADERCLNENKALRVVVSSTGDDGRKWRDVLGAESYDVSGFAV